MISKNLIAGLLGACLALTVSFAQTTPPTSEISGVVTSASSGSMLQGALVEIPALRRQTLTDNSGRYAFTGLPAGSYEVVVSYSGLREGRRTVAAGEAAVFELATENVLQMEKFSVVSEREGNALALTTQRNAPGLKNAIAMDAFGNMPNMGVGELAMRLPGAAPSYDPEGNVTAISVRGMPSLYTITTIDGNPTFRGNGARTTSWAGLTGAIFEQIELTKGHTPDQSANSLGGGINLRTRSPLNMKEKRRFIYNLGARWAAPFFEHGQERLEHPLHPLFNFAYQEAFDVWGGKRNLGVSASAFYSENVNAANSEVYNYQNTTASPAYIYDYRSISQINNRHITTANVKLEYRASATSKYTLGLIYNDGSEPAIDLSQLRFFSNQTVATLAPDGSPTGTGAILPGYTNTRTQVRGVAGSNLDMQNYHLSFYAKSPSAYFTGEHKLDRWEIDYKLAHTSIHIDRGSGKNGEGGILTARVPNIGWIIDNRDPGAPRLTQTEGNSIYNVGSYTATLQQTNRDEIERSRAHDAEFNAAYRLDGPLGLTLKTGLAFERRENDRISVNSRQWNRVAGAPSLPTEPMFVTEFEERLNARMPIVNPRITNRELANPTLWTEDLYYNEAQRLSQTKFFTEQILGGYVMAKGKRDRLGYVAGVRIEDTEITTRGNNRRKPATAAEIPDPVARARYDWGNPVNDRGSYQRSFPSAHLSYDLTKDLKARASWSTSFGRPNPNDLTPNSTIDDTAQSVTVANPALGPQYSRNIDLGIEYYFKPAGLFTVGWFQKSIEDYILTTKVGVVPSGLDNGFNGDYSGYDLFTRVNAGTATVKGWEVDYRQQFTFLPGPLKGIELAANFTVIDTKGDFGTTGTRTNNEVAGFVPRVLNVSLAYTYRQFGSRVTYNYTDNYLLTYSDTSALRSYQRALNMYMLNLSYRWRPEVTFSVDIANALAANRERYQFDPSRTAEHFVSNTVISFGVSGRF